MQPLVDVISADQLRAYVEGQAGSHKVFYGPLYSAYDLAGQARADNPLTNLINSNPLPMFQVSQGQTGQGFGTRPLRLVETNLEGAAGSLPGGYAFVAYSVGVHFNTQNPMPGKDSLTRGSSLTYVRHSTVWQMGATQFWPEASFGQQSSSVASTMANTLIQFGANGATGARAFPRGGEIYFPAKEVINFTLILHDSFFVTTDGLTWDGQDAPAGNGIPVATGFLVYVICEGFKFEKPGP